MLFERAAPYFQGDRPEPNHPLGKPLLVDPGQGPDTCGRWGVAPWVEGAFLSATARAAALWGEAG